MIELQTSELRRDLEHEKRSNALLRQDMTDREAKLADKERRVVELKNDIRGLEKLKFLQDHQVTDFTLHLPLCSDDCSGMQAESAYCTCFPDVS